ncbi:MAG: glutaredoxin 3 [Sphingomicrobium sp.]
MAKVEMYLKTTCPYCLRARQLLDSKGVAHEDHVVDMGGPKKQEMVQRANGRTTVPQIFIGGKHIGGCDDLMALDRQGKLDALLAG